MNEGSPRAESEPRVTREEVLAVYEGFVLQGAASPDRLDPDNIEVQKAKKLFNEWRMQEDAAAKGDEGAEKRAKLEEAKFYIDCGFTDAAYLNQVLDRLVSDARDIVKRPDDTEAENLKREYDRVITKIRDLLRAAE